MKTSAAIVNTCNKTTGGHLRKPHRIKATCYHAHEGKKINREVNTMKTTHNKQMKGAYEQYKRATATDLYGVYKSFSSDKYRAYLYCVELMQKLNGRGLKVLSGNSFSFSVGFEYMNSDTGEAMFAYITKDNDRCGYIQKLTA
jgi:hypothetical protein